MMKGFPLLWVVLFAFLSCTKSETDDTVHEILIDSVSINGLIVNNSSTIFDIDYAAQDIRIYFAKEVDTLQFDQSKIYFLGSSNIAYGHSFHKNKKVLYISPLQILLPIAEYKMTFDLGRNLGGFNKTLFTFNFHTCIDSTYKFPRIEDDELLTLVQRQTFKYFWDYAHPVSGLARERLGSGDVVTTGGSGFGMMAILVGIERNFITRSEGFERLNTIVNFLNNPETDRFHGAFPHWLNGSTGKVYPFSTKDNGGDLVETALLMQGMLTVREFFKNGSDAERAMCDTIQKLWEEVDWAWYRKNEENVLYWHWSPNYGWEMNHQIRGWNEALIVYVLAASSPTFPITKEVYDEGWARNGAYPMVNNNTFYGIQLPLGENYGGPLFFSHYSFLGLDPRNLSDQYANYWNQNVAHTQINRAYCMANPKKKVGYSADCWGLTASDIPDGYSASHPMNDRGVIAPTAAIASMPYTPEESLRALRFFYYVLGDKIWGEYGFKDAFSLTSLWFANSYIAIDQGPIVCMIENHRSGLLWDLFMGAPDVQEGLNKLEFLF